MNFDILIIIKIHTHTTELFRKEFLLLSAISGASRGLARARSGSHLNVLLKNRT